MMESSQKSDGKEHKNNTAEKAAAVIRERSASTELITEDEILRLLKDEHFLPLDANRTGKDLVAILMQLIQENEDLHKLSRADSQYYLFLPQYDRGLCKDSAQQAGWPPAAHCRNCPSKYLYISEACTD